MSKFNTLINSFKSGQLGQKLLGRTEIKEYLNGCEILQNMITLPEIGRAHV